MKKLMIAALVAAMGGVAMADDTSCGDPLVCPFIYRIKLAGKTVAGYATASNKVTCIDGKCWKKPASLRIAGYFYGEGEAGTGTCGDSCECKTKDKYTEKTVFWNALKREVKFNAVAIDVFEVLRNSGAKNKAQILITMDDLNLAGFGAFNPKTGNLKNANGFFAGKLTVEGCTTYGLCGEDTTDSEVYYFEPCDLDTAVATSTAAIAYGRWNLAYKADKVALAQKLIKKGFAAKENVWAYEGLVTPSDFVPAN